MSTATLLFVSTWLRGHARADRQWRPVPSASLSGRGRSSRGAAMLLRAYLPDNVRRSSAGDRAPRSLPPRRADGPLACAGVRFTLSRTRVLFLAGLMITGSAFGVARAQEVPAAAAEAPPPASRTIGGAPPEPCVVVDIAGHRAGHLDCATQALTEAARDARRQADAARDIEVSGAGSPDVQVGVASRAGTRLRLGPAFGTGVTRPAAPPPVNPNAFGRRP